MACPPLEVINGERFEMTIRKRQLRFAGALVRQGRSRSHKGPKGTDRHPPPQTLEALPRKGPWRKYLVYGVEVKDAYDWVTTAQGLEQIASWS